tara:strand:+ start:2928 stop:3554 length:627 start_codon:yes stop_codon:yes gene_type:complete
MSKYAVFTNKINNKKLIYYPCPKNANTSAKMFFAKHLNIDKNFLFLGDEIPQIEQTPDQYSGKQNIIGIIPSKLPFRKINVDIKCCIVRDPIKRFISAYKNRILYHRDIQFKDHSIDMVLEKLENNKFENKHFLPQTYFLGEDLNYYTFWSTTEEVSFFADQVNDFFSRKILFPKIQTGGSDIKIKLTSSHISKIEKIYAKDFKLIQK